MGGGGYAHANGCQQLPATQFAGGSALSGDDDPLADRLVHDQAEDPLAVWLVRDQAEDGDVDGGGVNDGGDRQRRRWRQRQWRRR